MEDLDGALVEIKDDDGGGNQDEPEMDNDLDLEFDFSKTKKKKKKKMELDELIAEADDKQDDKENGKYLNITCC